MNMMGKHLLFLLFFKWNYSLAAFCNLRGMTRKRCQWYLAYIWEFDLLTQMQVSVMQLSSDTRTRVNPVLVDRYFLAEASPAKESTAASSCQASDIVSVVVLTVWQFLPHPTSWIVFLTWLYSVSRSILKLLPVAFANFKRIIFSGSTGVQIRWVPCKPFWQWLFRCGRSAAQDRFSKHRCWLMRA